MQERRLGPSGELHLGFQQSRRDRKEFLMDKILFFLPTQLLHSSYKVVSYKKLIKRTTESFFISGIL